VNNVVLQSRVTVPRARVDIVVSDSTVTVPTDSVENVAFQSRVVIPSQCEHCGITKHSGDSKPVSTM